MLTLFLLCLQKWRGNQLEGRRRRARWLASFTKGRWRSSKLIRWIFLFNWKFSQFSSIQKLNILRSRRRGISCNCHRWNRSKSRLAINAGLEHSTSSCNHIVSAQLQEGGNEATTESQGKEIFHSIYTYTFRVLGILSFMLKVIILKLSTAHYLPFLYFPYYPFLVNHNETFS